MDRANRVLLASAMRPMNLLAPGAGLLLALTVLPWWLFPLSFLPYAVMVYLTAHSPAFIRGVLSAGDREGAGAPIDWRAAKAVVTLPRLRDLLGRMEASEAKLAGELEAAPESLGPVLASCLAQLRSAARLGVELATRAQDLERALETMDPDASRRSALARREQAERVKDDHARLELQAAARSFEEAAAGAEGLRRLHERTLAQLESLAASLESAAVRSVRVRVASDAVGPTAVAEALRVDTEALRETLGVFDGAEVDAALHPGTEGRR